jgi:chromate transport protein ChrA
MELRAVSAESWLTPLAVLVPIAGTLVLAAWALTIFPPLDLLVIVGGLAMTAAAVRHTYGTRTSLARVVGALVFFALGGFGFRTQRGRHDRADGARPGDARHLRDVA